MILWNTEKTRGGGVIGPEKIECDNCHAQLEVDGIRAELEIIENEVRRKFDFCLDCLSTIQFPPGLVGTLNVLPEDLLERMARG